jgi:membrane-associated phospholipid phosphatase
MARQRATTSPELLDGRGYALGRLLSQIFHPILMNIATFLIAGYFSLANHVAGLAWAGVCIVAALLPPTILYRERLRRGAYGDEDISIRQQRNELYLFGFVWVLIATLGLGALGLPRALLAFLIVALALGVIGGLINLFWKISVHSASIAATATVALLFWQGLGLVLWLCALAVGWARVRTGNHTPLQVLAGFLSASIVVLVVFQLVGASG